MLIHDIRTQRAVPVTDHRYGPKPQQYLRVVGHPSLDGQDVVIVHGGFWRAEQTVEGLEVAAADLAARGYRVVLVEYRTVEHGGTWPHCRDDVTTAIQTHLATADAAERRTTLVGHSAGGHLVLCALPALPRLRAAVALAPVTDLAHAHYADLGSGAVASLMGGNVAGSDLAAPELSPVNAPVPTTPVRLVHGQVDQTVPVSQTIDLAAAWNLKAEDVHLVPGARHMHLVRPGRPAWAATTTAIASGIVADQLPGAR